MTLFYPISFPIAIDILKKAGFPQPFVFPTSPSVIPASLYVIPAQAGIHPSVIARNAATRQSQLTNQINRKIGRLFL